MRKPIPKYENYLVDSCGYVINTNTNKILKYDVTNRGYHRITVCKNGETKRFSLHRLVAELFIPNPNDYKTVNHKKTKADNGYLDLEWMTQKQNQKHAVENGLCPKGEANGNSKWKESQILRACVMYQSGYTGGHITKETGLPKSTLDDIRRRKTWVHISKDYIW